jgi:hypothetical protein
MLSRKNAVIGWFALRFLRRRLRRSTSERKLARGAVKLIRLAGALVALGLGASWFLRRGGSDGDNTGA